MPRSWNWKIAGVAGAGIKATGEIMAKALLRSGYRVFGYSEYPSLIRGGHNTYQIFASEQASSPVKKLDVLVALNQEGIARHKEEWTEETVVIADKSLKTDEVKAKVLAIPLDETVSKLGNPLVKNMVAVGVSSAEMGVAKA